MANTETESCVHRAMLDVAEEFEEATDQLKGAMDAQTQEAVDKAIAALRSCPSSTKPRYAYGVATSSLTVHKLELLPTMYVIGRSLYSGKDEVYVSGIGLGWFEDEAIAKQIAANTYYQRIIDCIHEMRKSRDMILQKAKELKCLASNLPKMVVHMSNEELETIEVSQNHANYIRDSLQSALNGVK